MSAIPASSVSMKTMADGTLRISFDVEPSQAQDAFKLFAAPGTQVAIAALKDGSFLAQPVADMGIPITGSPPGMLQDDSKGLSKWLSNQLDAKATVQPMLREQLGDACYRTVLWCNEPSFWDFLNTKYFLTGGNDARNAADANFLVKEILGITSRKELDTNPEANKTWHREIRQPYADYLKRMEAA